MLSFIRVAPFSETNAFQGGPEFDPAIEKNKTNKTTTITTNKQQQQTITINPHLYLLLASWSHFNLGQMAHFKMHDPIFQSLVFNFIWKITSNEVSVSNFSWSGPTVFDFTSNLYFTVAYTLLSNLI